MESSKDTGALGRKKVILSRGSLLGQTPHSCSDCQGLFPVVVWCSYHSWCTLPLPNPVQMGAFIQSTPTQSLLLSTGGKCQYSFIPTDVNRSLMGGEKKTMQNKYRKYYLPLLGDLVDRNYTGTTVKGRTVDKEICITGAAQTSQLTIRISWTGDSQVSCGFLIHHVTQ